MIAAVAWDHVCGHDSLHRSHPIATRTIIQLRMISEKGNEEAHLTIGICRLVSNRGEGVLLSARTASSLSLYLS